MTERADTEGRIRTEYRSVIAVVDRPRVAGMLMICIAVLIVGPHRPGTLVIVYDVILAALVVVAIRTLIRRRTSAAHGAQSESANR